MHSLLLKVKGGHRCHPAMPAVNHSDNLKIGVVGLGCQCVDVSMKSERTATLGKMGRGLTKVLKSVLSENINNLEWPLRPKVTRGPRA
jgi:hypothetical protein